jgi:hypothetical protein
MAEDEAEYEKLFKIRKELDGKWTASSRDYTGKATTEYPNKDKYEGDYVNGVSFFLYLNLNFHSLDMEKVIIRLEMVLNILVIMLKIRSMVLLKLLIKNTVLILVK